MKVHSTGAYIKPQFKKPKPAQEVSEEAPEVKVSRGKPKPLTEEIANIIEGSRASFSGPEYYGQLSLSAKNGITRYDAISNQESREALKEMVGIHHKV